MTAIVPDLARSPAVNFHTRPGFTTRMRLPGALAWLCLAASLLVTAMLAIFLVTGVGQDPLQFVHPAAEYRALLLRNPPVLRLVIGLDNLFVFAYSSVFVLIVRSLWQDGAGRLLSGVALGLLMVVGLLDLGENLHFLAMISGAEQGTPPVDAEIAVQAVESMFKFHVSYLGLFLLGLALPRTNRSARTLSALMLYVQAPVGVAIYVLPHTLAVPLVFARFAFFLASFALVPTAVGYGMDRKALSEAGSAEAGSNARA